MWATEKDGSAITSGCQAGTPAADTTDFPTPSPYVGCCAVADGSTPVTAQIANYGRALENDDSVVYMRVRDLASTMTCVNYGFSYSFGE